MANTHKPTIATSSNKTSKPDFDVQNVSNGVLVCSPAEVPEPCGNETIETKKKESYFPIRGCEITIQDRGEDPVAELRLEHCCTGKCSTSHVVDAWGREGCSG